MVILMFAQAMVPTEMVDSMLNQNNSNGLKFLFINILLMGDN